MRVALTTMCLQVPSLQDLTCSTLSYTSWQPTYKKCRRIFAATPGWESRTNPFCLLSNITAVIFSVGSYMSLSPVQTTCQKSHADVLDRFLHLALLCKLTITTNNKDAPYSRISAIQLIYNQWHSFQANKIQGRLQRTMKDDGWPSTSWPIGRLFSKFHACGTEKKIGRGIPEESNKSRKQYRKPSREEVGVAKLSIHTLILTSKG